MKKRFFIMATTIFFCVSLVSSLFPFDSKLATNITPLQAYHMLVTQPNTYLVDVRTRFEYQLIGHPMWFKNGKMYMAYNVPFMFLTKEFAVKGQMFGKNKKAPATRYQFVKNKDFIKVLKKMFKPTDNLIFMCRSSKRSHIAADIAYKNGFKNSYNLVGGFEGYRFFGKNRSEKALAKMYSPIYGKAGFVNGWKYYELPYTYKISPKYVYPPDLKR